MSVDLNRVLAEATKIQYSKFGKGDLVDIKEIAGVIGNIKRKYLSSASVSGCADEILQDAWTYCFIERANENVLGFSEITPQGKKIKLTSYVWVVLSRAIINACDRLIRIQQKQTHIDNVERENRTISVYSYDCDYVADLQVQLQSASQIKARSIKRELQYATSQKIKINVGDFECDNADFEDAQDLIDSIKYKLNLKDCLVLSGILGGMEIAEIAKALNEDISLSVIKIKDAISSISGNEFLSKKHKKLNYDFSQISQSADSLKAELKNCAKSFFKKDIMSYISA